jgi:hypothetical protein
MKSERDPIWGPPLRDVAVKCRKKLKAVRQTVGKNRELDAAAAAIEKDLDQGGLIAAQSGHAILAVGYLEAIADLNQTDLATLEVGLMSSKSPRKALANTIRVRSCPRAVHDSTSRGGRNRSGGAQEDRCGPRGG